MTVDGSARLTTAPQNDRSGLREQLALLIAPWLHEGHERAARWMGYAKKWESERHRYYVALETLRDLRSSHDDRPLVANLQAREVIENALKPRMTP